MKTYLQIWMILNILVITSCGLKQNISEVWVEGVKQPVINLNGTWKFTMNPPENFWENSVDFSAWSDIQVPGVCQMQGFAIKHDQPYVYKQQFDIPEDYNEKQIYLNFYGVYSYARIWVNGEFVREHFGGFTKWSADISKFVTPGEKAVLTVEIIDRTDDISYASGYAKHQIGGILRDVELEAQPKQHFKKLFFETDLDENYQNAVLNVFYELAQNSPVKMKVEIFDNKNVIVESTENEITLSVGKLTVPVKTPEKWDSEHPYLYTVVTTLFENEKEILKTSQKIGFREVKVDGNKLLVNGNPVKLRGACRHDIHPLLGRMTTAEYDEQDVLLAKEANMNFIRTSHYPPSEKFLEYCDEYGIYVEDETAVCFVGSHRTLAYQATGATQNDSTFTARYLSQLEEMVQNHRDHASIIIWSIGNENVFGSNFVESFKWVKQNDTTRLVIFSYPGQVPDSLKIFDILSMHYPDWKGNLNQYGISTKGFESPEKPMLFDEWAHVACYNNFELKEDPNVRNFWGQSLDSMWTYTFESDGGLGGAIWCMIDETFMLPENLEGFNEWWGILDPNIIPATYMGPCVGYGEWGIIDTWRRKKPEFWNTKKAYSPTKIYIKQIDNFESGKDLLVPVHNRFDHTNFSELKIVWKYGNQKGDLEKVNLEPHQKGELIIPGNNWQEGEKLNLRFYQNNTFLIDEYNIQIGKREVKLPNCENGNLKIDEEVNQIIISGKNFVLNVNKKIGLFENVKVNDEVLIQSGPYINLKLPGRRVQYSTVFMQDFATNWKLTNFNYELKDGIAEIQTEGKYDSISAKFTIQIDDNGVFNIDYEVKNTLKNKTIQEAGLKFLVGDNFQKLAWDRESYFTAYPENHLGAPVGEVDLTLKPEMKYREKPERGWEMDSKGFYYFGLNEELPFTNIARSLKENIFSFSLKTEKAKIEVHSDGKQAGRFDEIDGQNTLIVNDVWDYNSLLWGNYMKMHPLEKEFGGWIIFSIN